MKQGQDADEVQTLDANESPIATISEYFYDGDGKRVKKVVPGGETTVFVYEAGEKLIGEFSSVVQTGSEAKTVYTTNDHLGSPSVHTDAIRQVIFRHALFGEEVAGTGSELINRIVQSVIINQVPLSITKTRHLDRS